MNRGMIKMMDGGCKKSDDDLVLIHGMNPDRNELHVIRNRHGEIQAGVLRDLEEGRPIHGDIVKLKPFRKFPLLCKVETILSADEFNEERQSPEPAHPGPAMVATEAYRTGWERVFGARKDESAN